MTDDEVIDAMACLAFLAFPRVDVRASDYGYDGWLVMAGRKRGGAMRCVVEDHNGRLFIHNPSQLTLRVGSREA